MKKSILLTHVLFLGFLIPIQAFITHSINAQVINLEGEMQSTVTAYITKRFSSATGAKNLKYRLYLPNTQSEGINTQTVSKLIKTFLPNPTDIKNITDSYGNTGLELSWTNIVKVVQIDVQFSVTTYSNFYPINSNAPFPVGIEEEQKDYLISTELSPSNDFLINYVARSLSFGLNSQLDVVRNIFLWIDKTISISNQPEVKSCCDALSVLKRRKGDVRGICNLAAAMLKGLGIPVRVAYGISFQKEVLIKTEQQNIYYDYPNDEVFWVEVFFPDLGWVSYAPEGTYFGLTSHVIRIATGPDSDYVSDKLSIGQGQVAPFSEFIYDIKSDNINLSVKSFGEGNVNKIILSPVVEKFTQNQREPDLSIGGLSVSEKIEEIKPGTSGIIAHNSDISQRLDIVATRNRVYAQKFTLNFPCKITEIRLPLIKFADEGRIWVEIYSDAAGVPGKVLFKTYNILSPRIRFMMIDNPWLSFPVGEKETVLQEGEYWMSLRSSGSCIFNWNATTGNVIGDGRDTIFMDVSLRNPKWNNVSNFDLNFQVVGIREK
ncbi:MAG: transglutaminase-like domain-containing protein [Spirochaetota bacterium]